MQTAGSQPYLYGYTDDLFGLNFSAHGMFLYAIENAVNLSKDRICCTIRSVHLALKRKMDTSLEKVDLFYSGFPNVISKLQLMQKKRKCCKKEIKIISTI